MRWRTRQRRVRRRPATSSDPVAMALDAVAGPLTTRFSDVVPTLDELPDWVDVDDAAEVAGFDTVVRFSDEVNAYCDPHEDGLEQALADQPGIEAVLAEDREVIHLRTSLALADVKAAVVRAVVEVNRSPRPPAPTGALPDETLEDLAMAVRPVLEEAGFAPTRAGVRYWYREGGDGFVQTIALAPGLGSSADGRSSEGLVWVMSGTHVPGFGREVPASADLVAPAHCGQPAYHWVAPTEDVLARLLREEVLPVLDRTRDRAGLAAWVADDPDRLPIPMHRPTYARLFAEWGLLDPAARVVSHVERHWKSLRTHEDLLKAREIIRAARG